MTRRGIISSSVRTASLLGCALVLSACSGHGQLSGSYLRGFAAAEAEGRTFVPVTEIDRGVTVQQAYELQEKIVAARRAAGDRPIGYKGSLMSAKSLADRGAAGPLTGILFASGDLSSGAAIVLCGYRRPALEMKLGFAFSTAVTQKVNSVASLRALVSHVQPVVELPDIAYRDDKTYGALDMVAANISSAKFVRGAPSAAFDGLDELEVTMRRDSAVLTMGRGRESFGDQWESLRALVNLAVARGGTIDAGSIVTTGKIGDKVDIVPGDYTADFAQLGAVRFTAVACPSP